MSIRKECIFVILSLYFIVSHAEEIGDFTWNSKGLISNEAGQSIQLDMVVFGAKIYGDALFLEGYRKDKKSGPPDHLAVRVSSDLKAVKYWSFDRILMEFFVYRDTLYLSYYDGTVYMLVNSQWRQASFKLAAKSVAVYISDEDLVTCYPSPGLKESVTIGGCCSLEKGWCNKILNWWELKPVVCQGYLYIFENFRNKKVVKKLDLEEGKVLASKSVDKMPQKESCDLAF